MSKYLHSLGKIELNIADYAQYKQILVQTAIFIYSKPGSRQSLGGYPLGFYLLALIQHFTKAVESKNQIYFYRDPDFGIGDRVVVAQFNSILENNPEAEVPENFQKYVSKEIDIEYNIPEQVEISTRQRDVLEIIDSLLFNAIGAHIIEP